MKKNNNKKIITAVISAMLVSIMAIGMLAGCSSKPTPPDDVSSNVSSEVNSTVSEPVESVESVEPSSEVVSEVSSEVPSVASVEPVESKAVSSTPVKETTTPPKTDTPKVESKPVEKPKPSTDPDNPTTGTIKIEGDRQMIYDEKTGKWWDNGPADQKVVDNSNETMGNCPDCGNPAADCTCRVGY